MLGFAAVFSVWRDALGDVTAGNISRILCYFMRRTSILHDELHWLDVPERVTYKMGVMMYRCLHGQAPRYLADHFITSSDVASRLRLRSANRHQLIVPRCRLNTYGRRAFSIAGPTVWNALRDELRDPACGSDSFKQFLKRQSCLVFTNVTSTLEVFKMLCAI